MFKKPLRGHDINTFATDASYPVKTVKPQHSLLRIGRSFNVYIYLKTSEFAEVDLGVKVTGYDFENVFTLNNATS